ncbi:MAG: hydrogenase 3 maturation endopeptidase HyCI [Methanomassiliicoccales archaeon]|nr:hydrogenase 3 maturation endopeptidase HyCI [Methanomassiliicoccales archaeon]
MREHERKMEEELRTWLEGATSVVVAGIGNLIRSDDQVGVRVVEGLHGHVSDAVRLIECETVPESFVDQIIEIGPTHVLMVDAALLGLRPGEAHLYEAEEVLDVPSISTHTLPLRVFCDYVRQLTGADIALLLIEPKDTDFGEGMTPEVKEAAARVHAALLGTLP